MALPLAWLAGVALQLQRARAAGRSPSYLALAAARGSPSPLALPASADGRPRCRGRRVAPAASRRPAGRRRCASPTTLAGRLEGRDLVVTGVVASLPQQGPSGLRFRFEVDARAARRPACRALLALGWYAGFHEDAALVQPRRALRAGQRWRFTVRLRQPHGNLNPHGFDYELALFEQGVRATGYVRDAPRDAARRGGGHPVERLRQRVRDAIYAHVPDRRAAGVLAALPSATRARSSATTGTSSATPASPT